MKIELLYCCFIFCSCQLKDNQIEIEKQKEIGIEQIDLNYKQQDSSLLFTKALVYEFTSFNESGELWFFVNEENGQILYKPDDDTIDAVISYPGGEYKIYGKNGKGTFAVILQKIKTVNDVIMNHKLIQSNEIKISIDQNHIGKLPIESKGYIIQFEKNNEQETVYITNQIPINARQIYGFTVLEGDAKIPIDLNFLNVLNKHQLITHIESPYLKIKLLDYGDNPYYFSLKPFKNN